MKFGLLGCGMIADVYLSAIEGIDDAVISGVYDLIVRAGIMRPFKQRKGI